MGCPVEVGDIIVVKKYVSHGQILRQHSFVVISTDGGQIRGLDYDVVCNVMSSFHSEQHRQHKLSYPGNLEYSSSDERIKNGHGKDGFIKADQFYFFNLQEIDYYVIGSITPNLASALKEFAENLKKVEFITENLK